MKKEIEKPESRMQGDESPTCAEPWRAYVSQNK